MTENKDLKKQKFKLTIFFSILVFLLAIFLEIIFFGFKYFSEKKVDQHFFLKQTPLITKKIDNQKDILDLFENTFLEDDLGHFREKHNSKKILKKINFLLINNDNEIVDKKIYENIDLNLLNNLKTNKLYFKNNYFILEKKLKNNILWDKIIFYKKLHYTQLNLLKDLLLFIFITFVSTIIFYIIWKKFVNKLLDPVEKNLIEMEEFIQNSSHEFKTPISIIHSNLQIIKAEKKFDEDLVKESIQELNTFTDLIDWLTELSWINLDLKKEKINLKKEIPEIVSEYIKKIKNKKIILNYSFKNNIKILASKQHFRILFSNLLSNAIKYNKIWWEIKISINKNKLIISDNWIWIEKENLDKIFNRLINWIILN